MISTIMFKFMPIIGNWQSVFNCMHPTASSEEAILKAVLKQPFKKDNYYRAMNSIISDLKHQIDGWQALFPLHTQDIPFDQLVLLPAFLDFEMKGKYDPNEILNPDFFQYETSVKVQKYKPPINLTETVNTKSAPALIVNSDLSAMVVAIGSYWLDNQSAGDRETNTHLKHLFTLNIYLLREMIRVISFLATITKLLTTTFGASAIHKICAVPPGKAPPIPHERIDLFKMVSKGSISIWRICSLNRAETLAIGLL
ncbi:hypothetical protein [Coleofasciculus sp. E1-EBD-02]|uniref:hypothetical protein n=1 Tax=Coleofasciculus sp. E1-EBD-02 TaxID=3068481 RepID=UPI0032F4B410